MSLDGATLDPVKYYGDLENRISLGTAAVFLSKDRFKENAPYSRIYDTDNVLSIYMNLHFLSELRRQLSGVTEEGTSTFSATEQALYDDYVHYCNGTGTYDGELLLALNTLDVWLIDELTQTAHPELNRNYDVTHKWRKTEDRGYLKGIQWI